MIADALFFLSAFLALYSYAIYPFLVDLVSRRRGSGWRLGSDLPGVSIVFSAYNEEKVIGEKIRNSLSLAYPEERLEVVVGSDGSTDGTDRIVAGFHNPRLLFRRFEKISGKTACLNRLIPEAKGDIILFTDANSLFPPDAVLKAVRHFASPHVGLVTGWTRYGRMGEACDEGIYGRLERFTKVRESRVGSCVGADGAIFVMRKSLFRQLGERDINDFVLPLHVVRQGSRVVMDEEFFCFEEPEKATTGEYRRQVRITTRTWGAILRNVSLLNPFKYGFFSFFLFSHKIMRFMVPFLVVLTFCLNILLIGRGPFYLLALCGQLLFFAVGMLGITGTWRGRLPGCIGLFLVTSAAQAVGWFRMILGITDTVWTTRR